MATLAAIPEANSYLHDRNRTRHRDSLPAPSFRRQRPKSRVVIFSRRSSRARTPTRKTSPLPASPGSVYSSDVRQAPEQQHADVCSHEVHKSRPNSFYHAQTGTHSIHDMRAHLRGSPDAASSFNHAWEPSELSVDLESFPLPPMKAPLRPPEHAGNTPTAAAHPSRNPVSTLPKPRTSACFPKNGFSSPPIRQRPHAYTHRSPRSSHGWLLDGAADFANTSKRASIDSALVEAISRSVCHQLRLFTTMTKNNQTKGASQAPRGAPSSRNRSHPRINGQPNSLGGYTEKGHGHPEGARLPRHHANLPATPTKSSISLHTVSPLLPFRPEFKAAGLAVTSKDQKRNFPAYIARLISSKSSRKRRKPTTDRRANVSRFDGLEEEEDFSQSSMSEISFAPSQDVDEWRYALIDEAPVRKQKRRAAKEKLKSKRRWFPCFPKDDESVEDGE